MAMEMVLGVSTTPRPSPALIKPTSRPHARPASLAFSASTAISIFSPHPQAANALTLPKEQIFSLIGDLEKTLDQVQELGSNFLDNAGRVYEIAANTLEPGIDAAAPIIQQAGEQAAKLASPAIADASKKAQEAIQSTGFDTGPVISVAKTVADAAQQTSKIVDGAKPIATSAIESIASADPIVIVGTAGLLYLTYILHPPILSAISFSLRGYKGELTAAQTLDLISTKNHLFIDIRPEKEKAKAGVPRLPSTAKNRMIAIPLEELPGKLKGLVRNAKKVEAELVALKISYLKKISKGSSIVIIDSYSDSAKMVARALTNLGYKNCWIVAGGFSGRRGWLQSQLGIDSYDLSYAEVLSPSRVIPAAVRRFGTVNATSSAQKLLP